MGTKQPEIKPSETIDDMTETLRPERHGEYNRCLWLKTWTLESTALHYTTLELNALYCTLLHYNEPTNATLQFPRVCLQLQTRLNPLTGLPRVRYRWV